MAESAAEDIEPSRDLIEATPSSSVERVAVHRQDEAELPTTIIEPRPGWQLLDLKELWRYRELLFFLTWRDVKVRYKQTVLGVLWVVLQPLATMLVFTLFFGRVAAEKSGSGALPYSLFVLAGLVPWTFFSTAIGTAGQSVVGSQNLVTKVYFPRLIIPMGAVGAALVDFAIAFGMLLVMAIGFGVIPGISVLLVPGIAVALLIATLGVGTLLSALTVAYRDFRHVVPFLTQFWMFATPSIYLQSDQLGPTAKAILPLNPAYGLIANFRASLLNQPLDWYSLTISAATGLGLFVLGAFYFKRVERTFADII